MGISYGEADQIAKMIEAKPGVKLKDEWDSKAELRELIESSTTYQELWDAALKLEGLTRNVGVHAAGVVIGDRPLDDHVPLTLASEGEVVTQYDMGAITEVGLLKMDFLGLKNLTVIHEAVEHIHAHSPDFDIFKVSLDDRKTFEILNRGETMGVFQLESGGMVETCRKYGIERIEDIIDLLALYRPGAMQFIDQMIEVKRGKKPVYEHPLLEEICGETYGVMIYQEQVQNAAKMLAGYTLGGADLLRRAMGKKKQSEMDKQRKTFVEGCRETNGIDEKLANAIFDKIAMFAGYGFNKSHSACYGHISYWTAYLKANFPVEFMCGLLSNEIHNTDKIGVFVAECHRMGIEILPPDLNRSKLRFARRKPRAARWRSATASPRSRTSAGGRWPRPSRSGTERSLRVPRRLRQPARLEGRQQADPREPGQGRCLRLDRVRPARRWIAAWKAWRPPVRRRPSATARRARRRFFDTMDFGGAPPRRRGGGRGRGMVQGRAARDGEGTAGLLRHRSPAGQVPQGAGLRPLPQAGAGR
jgi:DNA-directed DNA polymerase III PolC